MRSAPTIAAAPAAMAIVEVVFAWASRGSENVAAATKADAITRRLREISKTLFIYDSFSRRQNQRRIVTVPNRTNLNRTVQTRQPERQRRRWPADPPARRSRGRARNSLHPTRQR